MLDLTNKKFGRLSVIKRFGKDKYNNIIWECRCQCNNIVHAITRNLKNGNTKSCGCLQKEKLKLTHIMNTKHGHYKNGKESKIHRTWEAMLNRCNNPNNKDYKNYRGRGITVCYRWSNKKNGFKNFLEDMGEPPSKYHSIDRINNNDGYYKENCRWATNKEQQRNTRKNYLMTLNGKTQCLAAWAEEYNINYNLLWQRVYKQKWSVGKALTTPIKKRNQK